MAKKTKPNHGDLEAARHGITRSSKWHTVEKKFLADNPTCAVCGTKVGLQAHHHFPFHYAIALGRPDLELDPRNLITLCETEEGKPGENHHLLIGHLDNFKSSNLDVITDARKTYHGMTGKDIETDKSWLAKLPTRLKALDHMTGKEKKDFKKLMDATLPKVSSK